MPVGQQGVGASEVRGIDLCSSLSANIAEDMVDECILPLSSIMIGYVACARCMIDTMSFYSAPIHAHLNAGSCQESELAFAYRYCVMGHECSKQARAVNKLRA